MTPTEELRADYINAHRHDWTMHQEADWWLAKLAEREALAERRERERIAVAVQKIAHCEAQIVGGLYTDETMRGPNVEILKLIKQSDVLSLLTPDNKQEK